MWFKKHQAHRVQHSTALVCQVVPPMWALGRTHWLSGRLALPPHLAELLSLASFFLMYFFF